MAKAGFNRNSKTVASILHNDPGLQAAIRAAAEQVLKNVENDDDAFISEYHTDRFVAGVVVSASAQAKHGAATKAASAAGLSPG